MEMAMPVLPNMTFANLLVLGGLVLLTSTAVSSWQDLLVVDMCLAAIVSA